MVVFGVKPVDAEPSECTLHDPAFWQDLKSCLVAEALDDLQRPAEHRGGPVDAAFLVASIDEDHRQSGEVTMEAQKQQADAARVGGVGSVDEHTQQQSESIDCDMSLAAFHLFTGIIAAHPPFCAVFTDWLSMIAAVGRGFLPAATRTSSRRAVLAHSHVPLRLQRYQ